MALRQARGWSPMSPRPPLFPSSKPGCPLSHTKFLCVGGRKESGRGARLGQMVCARPYLLGVGRRAGAWRSSFTKPTLSPWQLGLRNRLCCLPAPPKASHPQPQEVPHTGTPSPPTSARSKPRPVMPRWGQAGVTRAAVPRGEAGEGTMGPGLWHLGCG